MEYGSSHVITRYPWFKYDARCFSTCTHAMHFVVMRHIRDNFGEPPFDYHEDEWAHYFKLRVADDYILNSHPPITKYSSSDAGVLQRDMLFLARFVLGAIFKFRDVELHDLLWTAADPRKVPGGD